MVFVPVSFVRVVSDSSTGGEGVVANLTVFLMRFASFFGEVYQTLSRAERIRNQKNI